MWPHPRLDPPPLPPPPLPWCFRHEPHAIQLLVIPKIFWHFEPFPFHIKSPAFIEKERPKINDKGSNLIFRKSGKIEHGFENWKRVDYARKSLIMESAIEKRWKKWQRGWSVRGDKRREEAGPKKKDILADRSAV
jgi:hypothetical protein